MDEAVLLNAARQGTFWVGEALDLIYHFSRLSSRDDTDEDFTYTFFNGKRRRIDQRPGATRSRLNYNDDTPVIVYEKLKPTGEASRSSNGLLPASGWHSSESKTSISCPVCMASCTEVFSSGRYLVVTLCGHVFCCQCAEGILKRNQRCPTCRSKISESTNLKITTVARDGGQVEPRIACVVCADSVEKVLTSDKYFNLATCSHIICNKCMRRRKRCRTCRRAISQDTNRRMYF